LVDNAVWDIRTGPDGKVWVTTDDGLCCCDRGIWSSFGARSGLAAGGLWPVLPLEDRVYVGTKRNGLAILNLHLITQPFPRIYLEKPLIEERSAHLRWSTLMPWNEIPPAEILTRYRIDGAQWSAWTTVRHLTFDGLSGDEHTFDVQAQNLFGNFDSSGVRAGFSIPPPFYARGGFLIPVVGSTLASLAFGLMHLRRKRKHHAEIQASEAKFRRLTEATFEGILIHDGGVILDANENILAMLGYEYAELVGTPGFPFLVPESRRALQEIGDDSGKIHEVVGVRKDGTQINLEVMGKTIPYGSGTARVAAVRDITGRKEAQRKLIEYQSQLRSLALELQSTEERERRRMATYLHDYIGQSLALCKIKLGSLPGPALAEPQRSHLGEIKTLLEQLLQNTKSLTFDLSPPVLYELGFEDALEWLCERIQEENGLSVSFECDEEEIRVEEGVTILLFHSVRELLINVVKHAGAKCARVVLRMSGDSVEVMVEDDGAGFRNPDGTPAHIEGGGTGLAPSRDGGGYGLFNVRERLTSMGGRIEISSNPGTGTRVVLTCPPQTETAG
jgi:PAS domain S-box-containing protein